MIAYALRRLLGIPLVLLATFVPALLLVHAAPHGPFDPVRRLPAHVENLLVAGCDPREPIVLQLAGAAAAWMTFRVDGCTGRSLRDGRPVLDAVAEAMPNSVTLALLALALALAVGIALGVALAKLPDGLPDRAGRAALAVVEAMPAIVVGPLVVLGGALVLGAFAPARLPPSPQWIVPAATIALALGASIARVVRDALLAPEATLRFRADLARGLSRRRARARGLRLAVLPVVAGLGPMSSTVLMSGIAIERIFDLPGLGPLVLDAADARDYNVLVGGALCYGALVLSASLVADLLYGMLDPRVRGRR